MKRKPSETEIKFLEANYIARIATVSKNSKPHIAPIYFSNDDDSVYFTTATTTSKFRDISENPAVSLVVDVFDADWLRGTGNGSETYEKAIVISWDAEVHVSGELYMKMYDALLKKYPDYNGALHWEPGELPIIRVSIRNTVSWGL